MVDAFGSNYEKMYEKVEKVEIYNDQQSWKNVYEKVKQQIEEKQK